MEDFKNCMLEFFKLEKLCWEDLKIHELEQEKFKK